MKQLNLYITEKLKLNKDIKKDDIEDLCNEILILLKFVDKIPKDFDKTLYIWLKEHNLNKFNVYAETEQQYIKVKNIMIKNNLTEDIFCLYYAGKNTFQAIENRFRNTCFFDHGFEMMELKTGFLIKRSDSDNKLIFIDQKIDNLNNII